MSIHLVQRLKRRVREPSAKSKGVDYLFELDYMGSAEFEYGALPAALREVRRVAGTFTPEPVKIGHNGQTAWFVGRQEELAEVTQFFASELAPRGNPKDAPYWLKESTFLRETYGVTERKSSFRFDGWWCIDAGATWALFKEQEHAAAWLAEVRTPKT